MVRTVAALALTVALSVPAGAAAHEPPHLRFLGRCGFGTVSSGLVTGDRYTGWLEAHVVAYSLSPAHNPVTITGIRCELRINGATVVGTEEWPGVGPVAVVPVRPVEFTAADTDHVDLCTILDVVDGHGQARHVESCPGPTYAGPFPPDEFFDLVDDTWIVFDELGLPVAEDTAETTACAATGGDVYAADELLWDCPPYA